MNVLPRGMAVVGAIATMKLAKRAQQLQREVSSTRKRLSKLQSTHGGLLAEAQQTQEDLQDVQEELLQCRAQHTNELTNKQQTIDSLMAEEASLKALLQQHQQELQKNNKQYNKLSDRHSKLQDLYEGLREQLYAEQDARSTAECGLAVMQQQLQEANSTVHQLQEEAAAAQEACTAAEYQARYLQQCLEVAEEHLEEMDDQLQAEQAQAVQVAEEHKAQVTKMMQKVVTAQRAQAQVQQAHDSLRETHRNLAIEYRQLMRDYYFQEQTAHNEQFHREASEADARNKAAELKMEREINARLREELAALKKVVRRDSTESESSSEGRMSGANSSDLGVDTQSEDPERESGDQHGANDDVPSTTFDNESGLGDEGSDGSDDEVDDAGSMTLLDLYEVDFGEASSSASSSGGATQLAKPAGLRVPQMDLDAFRSRNAALNSFQCNPMAACMATLFSAGGVSLCPFILSDAHSALQGSVEDVPDGILSAAGVSAFKQMMHAISAGVQGSDAAGESVVEDMAALLMSYADNADVCWRSRAVMWVAAVRALGGPVCGLQAMEGVLQQVEEAIEECIDVEIQLNQQQLQECFTALQGVGQALVPCLSAVA